MFWGDGGLWMVVSGLGECELFSSSVDFPEVLEMESAQSLNHAFTKLSERFETHRLSHTGSVYSRVFYLESDLRWYPLEYLKSATLGRAEHAVMAAGWQAIEDQLGWCKFPMYGGTTRISAAVKVKCAIPPMANHRKMMVGPISLVRGMFSAIAACPAMALRHRIPRNSACTSFLIRTDTARCAQP